MLSQRIARLGFSLKLAALNLAVRRLQRLPAGQSPGWLDVVLLALAWGNLGYAAGFAYLRHVGRKVAASQGPILECGSGATTLLIAALTAPRGIDFVVLEHNREWFEHLARVLRALGLGHVKLRHAPLVHAKQWLRLLRWLLKAPRNRLRLKRHERKGEGFAIVNDAGEYFSLLTAYVDDEHQRKQFADAGLRVLDRIGGNRPAGDSFFHYYVTVANPS